jgi:hypothetical protein
MKQTLLCITIATAIAGAAIAAHSGTVPKTLQQNLSTQKIGGFSILIPTDPIRPASEIVNSSSVLIPTDPIRPGSAIGIGKKVGNSGNLRMLNPQPLPPRE